MVEWVIMIIILYLVGLVGFIELILLNKNLWLVFVDLLVEFMFVVLWVRFFIFRGEIVNMEFIFCLIFIIWINNFC